MMGTNGCDPSPRSARHGGGSKRMLMTSASVCFHWWKTTRRPHCRHHRRILTKIKRTFQANEPTCFLRIEKAFQENSSVNLTSCFSFGQKLLRCLYHILPRLCFASVSSKTMASMLVRQPSIWSRAKSIPVKYPMAFGVVLSGFKTSFSDLLVQKVVEQREKVDWKRNAAFAAFGFLYLGGVQYTLYVPVFGRLFPNAAAFAAKPVAQKIKDVRGMMNLAAQTFLDQCVHHPLMYFPAFYCTKEFVMAEKPDLGRVLSDYRKNMKEDLAALWKIWVPATMVNFAFMPMHYRIPFVAGVSLLWTCVLSTMRGGDVVHSDDMVLGAVTGATYDLLREGLDKFNTTPVELDENMYHVNISAAGKQRPGLVALLARHLEQQGGNVTHSKMMRLGQEFVIQMHVAVPPEKSKTFKKSLRTKELTRELDIQITPLSLRSPSEKSVMGIQIHCVGADKPGMIAKVAEKMSSRGFSIENMTTTLRVGKDGTREFVIDALVSSPNMAHKENLDDVIADISTLKGDLAFSHFDIRVHFD